MAALPRLTKQQFCLGHKDANGNHDIIGWIMEYFPFDVNRMLGMMKLHLLIPVSKSLLAVYEARFQDVGFPELIANTWNDVMELVEEHCYSEKEKFEVGTGSNSKIVYGDTYYRWK